MHKSARILANVSAFREKMFPNFINQAMRLVYEGSLMFDFQQLGMQMGNPKHLSFRPSP